MKTFAIVPVKKFDGSKTRLSSMLTTDDRICLSSLMLDDTLQVLVGIPSLQQVVVVSADTRAEELTAKYGAKFLHEEKERGVNPAVMMADSYSTEQRTDATIVIPQDLPLLDGVDIQMVCKMAEDEDTCIVICPSLRYDGTNVLLRKPPRVIKTHYDSDSYEMHMKNARELGITVKRFFSKKLMVDLDTPEDARQLAGEATIAYCKTLEFIKTRLGRQH